MAAARNGEVRCQADGAVFDEDSSTSAAAGVENGVRDAADGGEADDSGPREDVTRAFCA